MFVVSLTRPNNCSDRRGLPQTQSTFTPTTQRAFTPHPILPRSLRPSGVSALQSLTMSSISVADCTAQLLHARFQVAQSSRSGYPSTVTASRNLMGFDAAGVFRLAFPLYDPKGRGDFAMVAAGGYLLCYGGRYVITETVACNPLTSNTCSDLDGIMGTAYSFNVTSATPNLASLRTAVSDAAGDTANGIALFAGGQDRKYAHHPYTHMHRILQTHT